MSRSISDLRGPGRLRSLLSVVQRQLECVNTRGVVKGDAIETDVVRIAPSRKQIDAGQVHPWQQLSDVVLIKSAADCSWRGCWGCWRVVESNQLPKVEVVMPRRLAELQQSSVMAYSDQWRGNEND